MKVACLDRCALSPVLGEGDECYMRLVRGDLLEKIACPVGRSVIDEDPLYVSVVEHGRSGHEVGDLSHRVGQTVRFVEAWDDDGQGRCQSGHPTPDRGERSLTLTLAGKQKKGPLRNRNGPLRLDVSQ